MVFESHLEKFKKDKRRVVLLGDESAAAQAEKFGSEWQVFDMGFKGDKLENVMWRVIQGALRGYDPEVVVLSAGVHNRGVNSPEEIAAAEVKLLGLVRARVPKAEIRLVSPGQK